jgi:hypothetical protein
LSILMSLENRFMKLTNQLWSTWQRLRL